MTDTPTPTPEAVAAILKDVTPGPWIEDEREVYVDARPNPAFPGTTAGDYNQVCETMTQANARFVAWARNNVEALAADRDAQKARADEAEAKAAAMDADREEAKDFAETCNSLMRKAQKDHEAAEAKVAKLVEALNKIGTLAPVEKPPEPYDEYGWQVADTSDRHAAMVAAKDMWTVADFARVAIAEVKG